MELIPSTLLYSQALALLTQISNDFSAGSLQSPNDIATQLRSVLTQFDQTAGQPLVNFQRFEDGEPPISPKLNSILGYIQLDATILQNQVDILNASTIFANNVISTNLLNASNVNAELDNKLDTLELYSSSSTSGNMVVFSDSFGKSQLTDFSFSTSEAQASIKDGFLTLSPQGSLVDLTPNATINILDTSNGFLGNNQEILDPNNYFDINSIDGSHMYEFVAETTPANLLSSLNDGNVATWIEYEYCLVSPKDVASAGGFNFTYTTNASSSPANAAPITASNSIDWSIGPPNGVLELDLQFDLGSIQPFNYITYTSFGLANNANTPVLIKKITCSPDGTTWSTLNPQNISVGTNTNDGSLTTTANYTLGDAVWSFDLESARYINFQIQQLNPININVGHIYYESGTHQATPNYPNSRVEGPVPTFSNLSSVYNPTNVAAGSVTQYREYFLGQRWAIGINEISIQQIQYNTSSSIVTKELKVGGTVNRVAIDADVYIPSDFDATTSWVNFYVSPDNGLTWFQINSIEDTSLGIPAIIAFNDPLPVAFQDPNVSYQNVPGVVNTLRLKIELSSPNDNETPIVKSYSLKVTTK